MLLYDLFDLNDFMLKMIILSDKYNMLLGTIILLMSIIISYNIKSLNFLDDILINGILY